MHVFTGACVCVLLCMCECMHVLVYVGLCMSVHMPMCMHALCAVYMYVYALRVSENVCVQLCACMYACVSACICACVCLCVLWTWMCICVHTSVHAYICMLVPAWACLWVQSTESGYSGCILLCPELLLFSLRRIYVWAQNILSSLKERKGKAQQYPNRTYAGAYTAITNRFNGLCGMSDCVLDETGD